MTERAELLSIQDARTQPSFSLGHRLRRVAWGVVYVLLFRPSPRPLHQWRSALLRAFGARIGKGCHIYPKCEIWAPWNLAIGNEVGIADRANLYSMATITIDSRAILSQGTHLCAGTHDYEDPSFKLILKPINVGREAWLCAESFVGPGVTVHEGAVVGARAVVTKDVPAWTVWAGNPACRVKDRHMNSESSISAH